MFLRSVIAIAASMMILSTTAQTASAQTSDGAELSAEEIKQRWIQQQQTRGLVLAPSTAPATAPETTTSPATTIETPVEYTELSPDEQVNVRINFDFDSAALRTDQKPKLDTLCEAIKSIDIPVFRIVGHTDASGSAKYNERLSLLRAKEVKRYMVNSCGIADERLEAVGVGERFLFNTDEPNADENRRVEFQVVS
jgi:OmpA-OmpF porin, OOP family